MLSCTLDVDAELRPLEPWQAGEFAAHVAGSLEHLGEWLAWPAVVVEPEGAAAFLQRYADKLARDEGRLFGIWVADKLVGGVLFRVWDNDTGSCEIGVWLAADVTGRGLVTKACRKLIDWAFGVRGMHRVEWRCAPGNVGSRAVAARLGMTLEGTLRETYALRGRRVDTEVWAVLAREWALDRSV